MANAFGDDRLRTQDALDSVLTRRVLAFLIDYAVVLLLMIPASVVLLFFSILTLGLGFYLFPLLFFAIAGLYFALTLSSRAQATPGMRVMDLVMLRDTGERIDFFTALLHVVLFWIFNSLLTPFVLLFALFSDRKRLLHDVALGTVQIRRSCLQ